MEKLSFEQLVDLPQVRQLLESHHRLSGMAYGLFDSNENNLIAVGWQDICTRFHRVHPVTLERCRESDAFIKAGLFERKDDFMEYRCKNGMIDIAIPIIIDGKHLATFFTGQFFYDNDLPDRDFFVKQAVEMGFPSDDYLTALDRVPVFNREHVQGNLLFLYNMVLMMAEMGMKNLRLTHEMEERQAAQVQLEDERLLLQTLIQTLPDPVWLKDPNGTFLACNGAFGLLFNDTPSGIVGRRDDYYVGDELATFFQEKDREAIAAGKSSTNEEWLTYASDGRHVLWETTKTPVYDAKGQSVGVLGIARDITKHRLLEQELRTKEQYQRALLDNFPFMVWLKDTDSRLLAVNRPYLEAAGLAADAPYFGKTDLDLFPADLAEGFRADDREVMATEQQKTVEELVGTPGHLRWHETYKAPVLDADGNLLGTVGFARDITDRKQSEQRLQLMNFALDHVAEAAILVNEQGQLKYVNEGACRTLGYSRDELLGILHVADFDPDWPADAWSGYWQELQKIKSHTFEGRHKAKDGHIFPVEINANYFEFCGQGYNLGLVRDITERKQMEQALQEERNLFIGGPNVAFKWRAVDGWSVEYVSPNITAQFGYAPDDFTSGRVPYGSIIHPDDQQRVAEEISWHCEAGKSCFEQEYRVLHADGSWCWIYDFTVAVRDESGTITHFHGYIKDITDRKQVEETLREREQQFRILIDNIPDHITGFDVEGRVRYINPAVTRDFGVTTDMIAGMTLEELSAVGTAPEGSQFPASIRRVLEERASNSMEAIWQTLHGKRLFDLRHIPEVDANGTIIGVIGIARDITERTEMEASLRKSRHLLAEAQRIAHVGSWELDLATNRLTWSDEIFRIFEIYPAQFDVSYEAFLQRIYPDDREMVNRAHTDSVASRVPYDIEYRLLFADGRIKYIQERCETYYNADGMPLRSMGTAQDVTERHMTEETLRTKQRKLAELELELSFAEERERQRIAAVLHDHIGQLLLLGRIKLGALLSNGQPSATKQTVSDVRTLMDEAIQSTRSLTVQLCPPVLSTMGLEPALELLCRQMLEEWELQVAFSDDQLPKPLSPEVRTVLYQTARELLINVGKHAGAKQACLAISRDGAMFMMTVTDNGAGFDPNTLAAASRQAKGFGLFNVMRRIRNLGGEMTLDSSPLQGTRVVIRIPLAIAEEGI